MTTVADVAGLCLDETYRADNFAGCAESGRSPPREGDCEEISHWPQIFWVFSNSHYIYESIKLTVLFFHLCSALVYQICGGGVLVNGSVGWLLLLVEGHVSCVLLEFIIL